MTLYVYDVFQWIQYVQESSNFENSVLWTYIQTLWTLNTFEHIFRTYSAFNICPQVFRYSKCVTKMC